MRPFLIGFIWVILWEFAGCAARGAEPPVKTCPCIVGGYCECPRCVTGPQVTCECHVLCQCGLPDGRVYEHYADARERAERDSIPLIVFVGWEPWRVPDCASVGATNFPGCVWGDIVIAYRPKGGTTMWRYDLRGRITDGAIRDAVKYVRKQHDPRPAPEPVVAWSAPPACPT